MISIVIPTCDRPEFLSACLAALASGRQVGMQISGEEPGASDSQACGQRVSAGIYEVIVSDDSYKVGTRQMVESQFPWVHWRSGPRRGPAANRNSGARAGHGRWLIFIDDDCVP